MPDPEANNGQNITLRLLVTSQVERALNRIDLANKAIDCALRRAPSSAEILIEKVKVQLAAKQYDQASVTLEAAQKLAPKDIWVYVTRAEMFSLKNPSSKSSIVRELEQALACPNPDAQSLAEIANFYKNLGNDRKSFAIARSSLAIDPHNKLALMMVLSNDRTGE